MSVAPFQVQHASLTNTAGQLQLTAAQTGRIATSLGATTPTGLPTALQFALPVVEELVSLLMGDGNNGAAQYNSVGTGTNLANLNYGTTDQAASDAYNQVQAGNPLGTTPLSQGNVPNLPNLSPGSQATVPSGVQIGANGTLYGPDGKPLPTDATGLPVYNGMHLDPNTGQPLQFDRATGQYYNPATGQRYGSAGQVPGGVSVGSDGRLYGPDGQPLATDASGLPVFDGVHLDPATGQALALDPATGQYYNPVTGQQFGAGGLAGLGSGGLGIGSMVDPTFAQLAGSPAGIISGPTSLATPLLPDPSTALGSPGSAVAAGQGTGVIPGIPLGGMGVPSTGKRSAVSGPADGTQGARNDFTPAPVPSLPPVTAAGGQDTSLASPWPSSGADVSGATGYVPSTPALPTAPALDGGVGGSFGIQGQLVSASTTALPGAAVEVGAVPGLPVLPSPMAAAGADAGGAVSSGLGGGVPMALGGAPVAGDGGAGRARRSTTSDGASGADLVGEAVAPSVPDLPSHGGVASGKSGDGPLVTPWAPLSSVPQPPSVPSLPQSPGGTDSGTGAGGGAGGPSPSGYAPSNPALPTVPAVGGLGGGGGSGPDGVPFSAVPTGTGVPGSAVGPVASAALPFLSVTPAVATTSPAGAAGSDSGLGGGLPMVMGGAPAGGDGGANRARRSSVPYGQGGTDVVGELVSPAGAPVGSGVATPVTNVDGPLGTPWPATLTAAGPAGGAATVLPAGSPDGAGAQASAATPAQDIPQPTAYVQPAWTPATPGRTDGSPGDPQDRHGGVGLPGLTGAGQLRERPKRDSHGPSAADAATETVADGATEASADAADSVPTLQPLPSGVVVDPASGRLTAADGSALAIDPVTGLPLVDGQLLDPFTGRPLPEVDGGGLLVDPITGFLLDPATGALSDPSTGQTLRRDAFSGLLLHPVTGALVAEGTGLQYDPESGRVIDPATGAGLSIDGPSGLLVDAVTGELMDPKTGRLVDRLTGLPFPRELASGLLATARSTLLDPKTGARYDRATGRRVPA